MIMKPTLLVSLIMFLLLAETQGIRLNHGMDELLCHGRINEQKSRVMKFTANSAGSKSSDEKALSSNGHISGWTRKLMTKTPSTTTESEGSTVRTTPKRHEPIEHGHSEHKASFSVNSPSTSEHSDDTNGPYPDVIDIAGMDYSSARRKPPIHN